MIEAFVPARPGKMFPMTVGTGCVSQIISLISTALFTTS
jgi:hypothetical protein